MLRMEAIPERYRETYKKAMAGRRKKSNYVPFPTVRCTPIVPLARKKTATVKGLARDRQKSDLRDGSGKIMRQNANESVLSE